MSEENEEETFELFGEKELILVSHPDKTFTVGEYLFETDFGIAINVTSKTDWEPQKEVDGSVIYVRSQKVDTRGRPFQRDLRRSIRSYIPWHRIDNIEAADEFYEEKQLQAFSDGLEAGFDEKVWSEKLEKPKTEEELVNPLDEGMGPENEEEENWEE